MSISYFGKNDFLLGRYEGKVEDTLLRSLLSAILNLGITRTGLRNSIISFDRHQELNTGSCSAIGKLFMHIQEGKCLEILLRIGGGQTWRRFEIYYSEKPREELHGSYFLKAIMSQQYGCKSS